MPGEKKRSDQEKEPGGRPPENTPGSGSGETHGKGPGEGVGDRPTGGAGASNESPAPIPAPGKSERAVEPKPGGDTKSDDDRSGYLICLGASAGGLETLQAFFQAMPSDSGAAFVIVSHLSPDFKSLMPELLSRHTSMTVRTAEDGLAPEPDTISIIPPGKNMVFQEGKLRLESQDRSSGHVLQLPIDIFLQSIAEQRPHRTAGVILSGTGSDGSRGIRALKAAGGVVFAQDPETARFDGMPKAAIDSGVVDAIGGPHELAVSLLQLIQSGALSEPRGDEIAGADEVLPVVEAVRAQLNQDLGMLRPTMLARRVRRRMALLNIQSIEEYAERLLADAPEARALKQDTLIGVTGFFRDPDAFRYLQRHLATGGLRTRGEGPFRVWVPACSSGEEVYSLAMLIYETMEASGVQREVKIFATDVDEDSLARASKATYPIHAAEDIGPARVERFFTLHGDTITARSSLREMVIFANHNLVRDPPFTKIDLVSCRNFLIYLTPQTQEAVLGSLHFSLKPGGTMFLGSAEALGKLEDEFETIDGRYKVYKKTGSSVLPSMRLRAGRQDPMSSSVRPLILSTRDRDRDTINRQVLEALVERDGRSVAVLSTEGGLIDIVSDAAEVLRVPKGRITSDVARMLAEPLVVAVTTGLQKLRRGEEQDARFVVALDEGPHRRMTVRLTLLPAVAGEKERVLMQIEPARDETGIDALDTSSLDKATADRLDELQSELMQTRESLQSTIEELQSANEEQQSTNEELVASNEELQSTNEELQSVNEELFTVNVEYQNKIQELAVVAADLNNLLRNVDVGILFLDEDLKIRKFTPAIDQVVKLVEHDVGRSIEHFAHSLGADFVDNARRVIETGRPFEQEGRSVSGSWLIARILPYLSHTGRRAGAVATFVDVTAIRNANELTRVANKQLSHAIVELKNQGEELEEIFSIVAHDLKRPVIALDGLLSLIREDEALHAQVHKTKWNGNGGDAAEREAGTGESAAEEDGAALLSRAIRECSRMRQMLLGLESVTEIQHRPLTTETVSVQPWLDELVSRFDEQAIERGVRINQTCDSGKIVLPTGYIEEIFVNLMENALKYGCGSPSPRIDIAGRIMGDEWFEFSVADNGIGIAPENHQKIFEPFRRLDPSASAGTGIGLLAVRRLVHKLNGTVTVVSDRGEGTKFIVKIPILQEADIESGTPGGKSRVLLVEDDLIDARSVERLLYNTHKIVRAQDMKEAEARLREERFEVVLLDLSLPDGHGLELVNRMTTVLDLDIPVVVISGHGDGLDATDSDAVIGGFVEKTGMTKEILLDAIGHATNPGTKGVAAV